eukprot:567463_1
MGKQFSKCVGEEEESYVPPPRKSLKKGTNHHKRVETDEFISQYGSYFSKAASSSSSGQSQSSNDTFVGVSSSYSSTPSATATHTYTYSCSSVCMDKPPQGHRCDVESCESLEHIISALQWHSSMQNCNDKILFKMDDDHTANLMDDYQHLLMNHLFEMDAIRAQVNELVPTCNPNNCGAYKRYTKLCSNDVSKCNNMEFLLFVNIMDLVHCYMFHSNCSK